MFDIILVLHKGVYSVQYEPIHKLLFVSRGRILDLFSYPGAVFSIHLSSFRPWMKRPVRASGDRGGLHFVRKSLILYDLWTNRKISHEVADSALGRIF